MKQSLPYTFIISVIALLLFGSCQLVEETDSINNVSSSNKFVLSFANQYSLDLTRSNNTCSKGLESEGDIIAQLQESDWDLNKGTRSNITGEELNWEDWPCISLYMAEGEGNYVDGLGDMAFNPIQHLTYTVYRPYDTTGKDNPDNYYVNGKQTVDGTSFFWETKINRASSIPESLNFYGYYPRPCDSDGNDLYYKKLSIIEKEKAHAANNPEWYLLPYTFEDLQTSDNLSYHDVMCSIPENAAEGRYGNIDKNKNSNVQLHFKHVFSLLNIEIDKGDEYDKNNDKKCDLSDIEISGTEVYLQGTLNIKNCTTTPTTSSSGSIKRYFTDASIKDQPYKTTMIVQPIDECPNNLSEEEKKERFKLQCTIDGTVFKCYLPDIKLEAGKKYDLKLKLSPSGGLVFRVWNGAKVVFGNSEYEAGEHIQYDVPTNSFSVKTLDSNVKIVKVLRNGVEISENGSSYTLDYDGKNKVYYDVITTPQEWYCGVTDMNIHFDAIWNNKYESSNQISKKWATYNTWSDLSGNGNDGTLKSFNGTDASGWLSNGLKFDGDDDIVTYPGNINEGEYSMELYVYVPSVQQKNFARLIAEGNDYPCYYINGGNSRNLQVYSHGNQGIFRGSPTLPENQIVQLDYVYSEDEPGSKTIKLYINGEKRSTQSTTKEAVSIPIASLGNRINDNTRAINATFYSYIQYNRALTEDEIKENYEINKTRFGTSPQ